MAGVSAPGGLELWLARLDDFVQDDPPSDPDEAVRAAGIADPIARSHYLVSRALLRRILAGRLHCDPQGLRFSASTYGKPGLYADDPSAADRVSPGLKPSLHFNLSHAGGWLLVATREAGPVGVDLEVPRAGVDMERLASRVFSPAERAALQQASKDSPAAARRRFYGCWTRKEALLKCLGTGFAGGAAAFDVGAGPGAIRVATPGHAIAAVCVASLDWPPGHAAVAWSATGPGSGSVADPLVDPVTARWWLEPAA